MEGIYFPGASTSSSRDHFDLSSSLPTALPSDVKVRMCMRVYSSNVANECPPALNPVIQISLQAPKYKKISIVKKFCRKKLQQLSFLHASDSHLSLVATSKKMPQLALVVRGRVQSSQSVNFSFSPSAACMRKAMFFARTFPLPDIHIQNKTWENMTTGQVRSLGIQSPCHIHVIPGTLHAKKESL
jgi:hypothetical protein